MSYIEFKVNGAKCTVDTSVPRDTTLNAYLRNYLALPGTKAMCHQGGCGACVVAVRAFSHTTGAQEIFSVNSCLILVFSCNGWDITTIEGLGNRNEGYHPIQLRTVASNATQCGFCTSGWEMHLYSLLNKKMTMAELESSFGSNTCRCTGYRPILDTIKSFAVNASVELCEKFSDIEELSICKKTQKPCERKCSNNSENGDWTVINELAICDQVNDVICLDFGVNKYFKVFKEDQILKIFVKYGVESYMLVDGNTARGILGIYDLPIMLIDIRDVPSLKQVLMDQNLELGANVTLQDCITHFKELAETHAEFAYLEHFSNHILNIAHIPVRNVGTLAGNLMLKHRKPSFPSDVFVFFATVGATMTISNMFGNKKVLTMAQFLKHDMQGVLIVSIQLPPFGRSHIFRSYKIAVRSQNSTAVVNAGFLLNINTKNIIQQASIVYGNISPSFIHATRTEAYLVGKNVFSNAVLQNAVELLDAEIVPAVDPAEPEPSIRKKLAIGLFYKFVLNICPKGLISSQFQSGAYLLERPVSSGKQEYQTNPSIYPITQPVEKYEGLIQSSGEAQYANDLPTMKNEVFGAFVLSTVHRGEVDYIDVSAAMNLPGVITLYTAKDIPGVNSFTVPGVPLEQEDEEIIVSKKILFYGQPIAIIVAETQALAAKAATQVKVTYKNVSNTPPVLTIEEAKKDSDRYIPGTSKLEPTGRGTNVTKVVKGVYEIGSQYHYYIEPLTCVVVPVDRGLEVYESCQWMDLSQAAIARCLNMKESDVLVKTRRAGGAFGGKISRNVQVSTACALVAKKLDRPCRFILPMPTNMAVTGKRLPSQCEYEVGVDNNGVIQYLDATIVEDVGCSNNETILLYTVGAFRNCYKYDKFNVKAAAVLTDLPSNSFCRGPGTVEGISSIEHIMEHIAFVVNKDPTEVRLANMRTEENDLPQLIKTLKKTADYDRRYKEIQQFNRANRWVKKAIKISTMLFGVQYFGNYSVMISIFRDGSVTVTAGGIEIGQGLNTKLRQVVAYELGITMDLISILPNFCFVAADNNFTGSSIVSESLCYAAIKVCSILKERLKVISESLANPNWSEITKTAYDMKVNLVAQYMMSEKEPDLENYNAFGVAILEGELDVLTGKYILNRLDILEDVGQSTNPAIDIGQVEGAYVQGLSYYTTEKFIYDKQTGKMLSNDATTYFVYLAKDIPVIMNVSLRSNSKNSKGVLGSKAVGEMGICTAHGVTHVLRQCIHESRKDSGYDARHWINIEVPYTTETILKALNVKPTEFVLKK